MPKSLSPKSSSVSTKLGSYNSAKRTIGKNQSGKNVKVAGLKKASKAGKKKQYEIRKTQKGPKGQKPQAKRQLHEGSRYKTASEE